MSIVFQKSALFFPGAINEDIFGEYKNNQIAVPDEDNTYLFKKYFLAYWDWSKKNGHMYKGYESDQSTMDIHKKMKWVWSGLGILFMGMVFNPNYTSPRSFYARKINICIGAYIGYAWGLKKI